jgi:hypothetical protein
VSDVPDIYTEPEFDPNTLANLGPLAWLAGTFVGNTGTDVHPFEGGDERDGYHEVIVLEPIDPQTNGPQLLYGLRYHQHVRRHGEIETFHDQVGYWLYEPATGAITHTLAIPRAQIALATGVATPDATTFTVRAERGSTEAGICSGAFLERHFTTVSFEMTVEIVDENSWRYREETVMRVTGRDELVRHVDESTLTRTAPATPNALARE